MNEEDKVIDIKDMLYRICMHWRNICVVGLILLVCPLLMKFRVLIELSETSQNSAFIEMIVKYGGVGLVIGIVIAVFFYMVSYIFSDKIYLAEELGQAYDLNLIGTIPRSTKKRKNLIDHLIKKFFGVKILGEMQETLAERAAEEVAVLAAIRGKEWPDIPVVALVSSYSVETTVSFEMLVAKKLKKDVRLVNAGNILQDARSIRMVERADFVVLVEKQGYSTFKEYKETCRKLSLWGKDILGVVLLDVV